MAEEQITIPKQQLETLLDRLKGYEAKEAIMADTCFKAMETIGLIDPATNKVYDEVAKGENIFGRIIKTVKSKISVSDYFFNKEKFENELSEQFTFLKPLLEIGQEYANRKSK